MQCGIHTGHAREACTRSVKSGMHTGYAHWTMDIYTGHALMDEILNQHILPDCKENICNCNVLHLSVLAALCAHCLYTLHLRLFMLMNMQNGALLHLPPQPHLSFEGLFTLYST
jgi:hypothetical protein